MVNQQGATWLRSACVVAKTGRMLDSELGDRDPKIRPQSGFALWK